MTPFDTLVGSIAALRPDDLERWVRDALIAPVRHEQPWVFAEPECARIRLICTLHYDLEVTSDALPVVLSLLDQLYQTRADLRALTDAVLRQGPEVQADILRTLTTRPA